MLNSLGKLPANIEQKVAQTKEKMDEEVKQLNSKLDRKVAQLEKFEVVVKEAVVVQKNLRDSVKTKQQEIQDLKVIFTQCVF